MRKIIWLDIGTHFAQEYNALFGSNLAFLYKLLRRLIGSKLLKMGTFPGRTDLLDLVKTRWRLRKMRHQFHFIFVEANPKIICTRKVYLQADSVFNIALTDSFKDGYEITRLFIVNDDPNAQGNSIYSNKGNIDEGRYTLTSAVSSEVFMTALRHHLDARYQDYKVLLRVNCEGAEDSAIYSASWIFQEKLSLVAGSLKDVKVLKGSTAMDRLTCFINEKKITFVPFSSSVTSWQKAQKSILNVIQNQDL